MSDLNIDDYSNYDILDLLELNKEGLVLTQGTVDLSIYNFMERNKKFQTEKYIRFFNAIRLRLYDYIKEGESENDDDDSDDNLEENSDKKNDNIEIDRTLDKAVVVNNDHYIIPNSKLPIKQSYDIPIVQGQINPNLQNVNNRVLSINSQYRQNITTSGTDFTMDLNESLSEVVQMTLLSFEITHSWYAFDTTYGTTAYMCNGYVINIEPGNYTPDELVIALNNTISPSSGISGIVFSYNKNNGKVTINNTNPSSNYKFTFFSSENLSSSNPLISNQKVNSSLGYLLGFKMYNSDNNIEFTLNFGEKITGNSIVDVYGPKYLLLGIEDFNNNKLNKGVISSTDEFTSLNLPSYYNCDVSLSNPLFTKRVDSVTGKNIPSGLTTAQGYTITEIYNQQKNKVDNKYNGSISSNVFARIPINKGNDFSTIINTTSNLRNNLRKYYGPVDITRLRITLYDDKGYILNINNNDFSFSLLIDELYQY